MDGMLTLLNKKCSNSRAAMEYYDFRQYFEEMASPQHPLHCFHDDLTTKKAHPLSFWISPPIKRKFSIIAPLAKTLFSLTPSSVASERNFSAFGFIHSKLRNKLLPDNVRKLVYVFANSKNLDKTESDEDEDDESDLNAEDSM